MNQNQTVVVKRMSDHHLLANTERLVGEERRITLEILQHLREIEVRRLFVDLGFESMYKYCIQHLKYSEGEAQRRLSSARLLRELPEIESQIQSGDLNLTNLSAVQSFVRAEKMADKPLTREKKLELLAAIENKSTRQVKTELIQKSHQPALLADKFQMTASTALDNEHSSGISQTLTKFDTTLSDENLALLQEFRDLYAHDLIDLSNHSVLMFLLKKAVQHKKQRLGLIEKPSRKSNAPLPSAAMAEPKMRSKGNAPAQQEGTGQNKVEQQRKALSMKLKRMVWKRANACCEYIDRSSKNRCTSKFALEADHIVPVALGGANDSENLRLLCRAHNSRRAIKTFGREYKQ